MMTTQRLFARFFKEESGATAIEYCLIAGLIGLAIITGATTLGTATNSSFAAAADGFP
jgi:pilus assembly protein Flp/PilA